jgi:hypothetical protein
MSICSKCWRVAKGGSGRCVIHERAYQAERNVRPERAKYGGSWKRDSLRARARQPLCIVCGTDQDTSIDHTSGLTVCRSHHPSEAHGGVARLLRRMGPRRRGEQNSESTRDVYPGLT